MKMKKKLIASVLSIVLAISPITGVTAQQKDKTSTKPVEGVQNIIEYVKDSVVQENEKAAELCATSETPVVTQTPAVTTTPTTTVSPTPTTSTATTVSPTPTTSTEASMSIYNSDGKIVTLPTPYYYTKTSQLSDPQYNSYDVKVSAGYESEIIIPVKVKSRGALIYALIAQYASSTVSDFYTIYSDAACTKSIKTEENEAFLPKAGTYYIKADKNKLSTTEAIEIGAAFAFVSGADTQLKNKSDLVTATFGTSKPVYFKMVVTKATKITLTVSSDSKLYTTLCNSKKTAITAQTTSSGESKLVYVVAKGTYYLRAKSAQGYISVASVFASVSNASTANKSKAGTLKVNGATRNALVFPGDSTKRNYYLKFYNLKSQKIYLNVTTSFTSGSVKMEFIDAGGTSYGSKTIASGVAVKNVFNPYVYGTYSVSSKILPKGTYYIKLSKTQAKTSGIVQVNVKNKAS